MKITEALQQAKPGQITLVQAGTGRGKTYSILHTDVFADEKVLLSVSRSAIRSQTYQNAEVNLSKEDNESNITVVNHQEGAFWRDRANLLNKYDVFIVDEAHALLFDGNFTNGFQFLLDTMALLAEEGKKVVFMSATLDGMEDFIAHQYPLVQTQWINCGITTKPPGRVSIKVGTNEDFQHQIWKLTKKDEKVIIGGRSNGFNYTLYRKYDFLAKSYIACSESAQTVNAGNGVSVSVQKVHKKEVDHLITTGELPEDCRFFYFTSAFREGLNINEDQNVDRAIVNFLNPVDNIQAIGRYRGKLKEAIIIIPSMWAINKQLEREEANIVKGVHLKRQYEELLEKGDFARIASIASSIEGSGWFDVPSDLVREWADGKFNVDSFTCTFRYNRLAAFRWMKQVLSSERNIVDYYGAKLGKSLPLPAVDRANEGAMAEILEGIQTLLNQKLPNMALRKAIIEVEWKDTLNSKPLSYKRRVEELEKHGFIIENLGQLMINGSRQRYSVIRNKE